MTLIVSLAANVGNTNVTLVPAVADFRGVAKDVNDVLVHSPAVRAEPVMYCGEPLRPVVVIKVGFAAATLLAPAQLDTSIPVI